MNDSGTAHPTRGLLDTSVFIAGEAGRPLDADRLPAESAISVVTVAELRAGVLAAADLATRARRLATIESTNDMELIPVDERAAHAWAEMRVFLAQAGRRINVNDLWIAASATSRNIPVVTQDADFDALEGFPGFALVHI